MNTSENWRVSPLPPIIVHKGPLVRKDLRMTRRNLTVYNYRQIPDHIPASKRTIGVIDSLDGAIENLWTPEIKELMNPIGHPNSKRFFIQQYKAATLLKVEANAKGLPSIGKMDEWALMSALRRVAARRGISPKQLLISTAVAAE
jgi:hypothetical protein